MDKNDGKAQKHEEIAIVGIGCRFAGGANDPKSFWENLISGRDCITEVPEMRWNPETYYSPEFGRVGKSRTKWGGFVDNIDRFDAQVYAISPREAELMDPQQRLLLEVCWEAFEDAGIAPCTLRGSRTGVYVGGFTLDYMLMQLGDADYRSVQAHTATGSMMTLLSNRLSYIFGLNGPSLSVDTACSSSLVAVHLACRSLISGETSLALAGGVNALLTPGYTIAESAAGMLSPTGRSRAFDSRADGYVRGEGAGIVVLKRLADAVRDGDPVYAVIRSTAVNQDGASAGLTVPSGDAQIALMHEAYDQAGVAPADVHFVEAHGTGTPVGDPIEANAIGTVMSTGRAPGSNCYVSSVKTNIGHTEAAAGVAGLIKTALCLSKRELPPHLHFLAANPKIDFRALKLELPLAPVTLPAEGTIFAGVNSFGFGGTNAHAVLQSCDIAEPAQPVREAQSRQAVLLPISARSEAALRQL
ncbi:MAG TPA: polyketide synthase, partial [Bryobacteraceae bacterium]|nr:polyketide synthase [Bryobacteraceae bacterium]